MEYTKIRMFFEKYRTKIAIQVRTKAKEILCGRSRSECGIEIFSVLCIKLIESGILGLY